jgi:hypothetical protein
VLAELGLASGLVYLLLEHLNHWVPGPTDSEATIPVKVFGVKSDLNSLLYHAIHISCGLIEDGSATEVNVMPCFKSVLCHSRLLCLAQAYISRVFFISGSDLSAIQSNEDVKHILLSCPETKKWRMQFMNKKWLCINEELTYKKTVNCTNKAHTIHLGEYLDKVKHKLESRVRKE